jgi:SAM-dependent methyltransferase
MKFTQGIALSFFQKRNEAMNDVRVFCHYCGLENQTTRIFCKKCGYPISAATIGDFSDEERASVLHDLLGLYKKMKADLNSDLFHDLKILDEFPLLRQYLNYGWLRPLAGVWDASVGTQLSKIDFPSPSLDIGCGDGIFASIFMGVKYDETFDISMGMKKSGKDLFDHYQVDSIGKYVREVPQRIFDIGVDIKESLVLKAAESGGYKATRVDDGVLLKTVPSGTISSIWSNVIKNFDDVEVAITNVHRVLKPGGFIITQLPLPSMLENLYYYPQYIAEKDEGKRENLWKLTRGEPAYHPRYLSTQGWKSMFAGLGFSDIQVVGYVVNSYTLKMWDTGFRLFVTELAEFTNFLSRVEASPVLKKLVVDWYIQQSIPLLNYEKIAKDPKSYSFVLLKAIK